MKKRIRHLTSMAICLITVCLSLQMTASAADGYDSSRENTLTAEYKVCGIDVAGAQFDLYRIAERTGYSEFEMLKPFDSYPAAIQKMDQEKWKSTAVTLSGYIVRDQVAPLETGCTNENGELVFNGLSPGLYLVIPHRCEIDGYAYSASAFFVALPGGGGEAGAWEYASVVNPKGERERITVEPASREETGIRDEDGIELVNKNRILGKTLPQTGVSRPRIALGLSAGALLCAIGSACRIGRVCQKQRND